MADTPSCPACKGPLSDLGLRSLDLSEPGDPYIYRYRLWRCENNCWSGYEWEERQEDSDG